MLFILLTGMPGSGKSIFVEVARSEFNIPVYNMGDVVREETTRKYGVVNPQNILNTAIELREKYGLDYVARRVFERIDKSSRVVLIDGVRSLHEVEFFRRNGKVVIVAVHASPSIRFNRLLNRNRPGDPKDWSEFVNRDKIELSFGIGNVIALADYVIINESSIDDFRENIRKVLKKIIYEEGLD